VAFSIAGILPPNSWLFTLMEVGVLIVALVWYYFNCRKYPQAGLLLAVLPLFFAWRSFSAYFYFASLLVFGAVIIEEYRQSAAGKQPQLVSSAHA
jgi:bacteriorhodopsin